MSRFGFRRLGACAPAFAIALMLVAAPSAWAIDSAEVSVADQSLTLQDLTADDNAITISANSGAFFISEMGAGLTLRTNDTDCSGGNPVPFTATNMTCTRAAGAPMASVFMFDGGTGQTVSLSPASSVPITATMEGGNGEDNLNGGAGSDSIDGMAGDDTLNGGDGTMDELIGGDGNDVLDGQEGNDLMSGGRGGDVFRDSGTTSTTDIVTYDSRAGEPDAFRGTDGVTANLQQAGKVHGGAQDEFTTDDGGAKDEIQDGVNGLAGTEGPDNLNGDEHRNSLAGHGGNDLLGGGTGNDSYDGGDGGDNLNTREGVVDSTIDCGGNTGVDLDVAFIDMVDPDPTGCDTVERGNPSGGGGGTGGGSDDDDSSSGGGSSDDDALVAGPVAGGPPPGAARSDPIPPVTGGAATLEEAEPFPTQTIDFPDYLSGTRLCGAKRYCLERDVKRHLDKLKLNVDYEPKPATTRALENALGERVKLGQVLRTDPKAGESVTSSARRPLEVEVATFSPEDIANCNLERPFVRVAGRIYRLVDHLNGMTPTQAEEALKDAGCPRSRYDIVEKQSARVTDVRLSNARLVGSGKTRRVELTVTHPVDRLRFTLTKPRVVSGYLPLVLDDNKDLSIVADVPFEIAASVATDGGVGFSRVTISLLDDTGRQEAWGQTGPNGIATVNGEVPAGRYKLWAQVCDPEGDCVVGSRAIRAFGADARRSYLSPVEGREFRRGTDGKWGPVAKAAGGPVAHSSQAASDKATMGNLATKIITQFANGPLYRQAAAAQPNGELLRVVQTVNAAAGASIGKGAAGYYDALVARGVDFAVLAGGGNSGVSLGMGNLVRMEGVVTNGSRVGTVTLPMLDVESGVPGLKVGNVLIIPGGLFYVLRGGGNAMHNRTPVTVSPGLGLDLLPLNGAMAVGLANRGPASLIGADGGTLIGADGGSLIGADGATLVGMDGATLIGADGASIISRDGAGLIGADGASLIGADGASLIGADGATLVDLDR